MTRLATEPTTDAVAAGVLPGDRRRGHGPSRWWGLSGVVGLVVLVELMPRTGLVSDRFLPPASEILRTLGEQLADRETWVALLDTMQAWAIGLAIALTAGIVLGIVIGTSRFLHEATASTIEFLRPIPSVALIPLAVLLYGTKLQSTLLLVVYAAFWQVLIQVLHGVHDVDPVANETARSYGLGRWARIWHVTWPTALPYVMTGVRLSAAVALVLAVSAELIIGGPGLGHQIAVAQSSGAVPAVYALVVITGAVGVVINLLARFVERLVLSWHPSVRGEAPR